jgi:hypothetical protein
VELIAAIMPDAIKTHKDLRIAFSVQRLDGRPSLKKQTGFDASGQFTFVRGHVRNFEASMD